MGISAAAVVGLVIWIVMWSLNVKAIDAFMITVVIVVVAVTVKILLPYLPGKRDA